MKFFTELLLILGIFLVSVNCNSDPNSGGGEIFEDPTVPDDDTVIEFAFYATPQEPPEISNLSTLCEHPDFDVNDKTIFLFYGLSPNSSIKADYESLVAAYSAHLDIYNLIVFDVDSLILDKFPKPDTLDELNAAVRQIFGLLNTCVSHHDIEFVGFSMGAQIAGYVARQIKEISSGVVVIPRLIALEPAKLPKVNCEAHDETPEEVASALNLNANDADFVMVVFTELRFSDHSIEGHVTFYPNGDELPKQPGCWLLGFFHDTRCAVKYLIELWAEAVRENTSNIFMGVKCASYEEYENNTCDPLNGFAGMNPSISSSERGTFFLETNKHAPYNTPNKYL